MRIKLTKRGIESFTFPADRPEGAFVAMMDSEIRGFGVRVRSGDRKAYIFRYRTRDGLQRTLQIGDFHGMTLEEAREVATEWRATIDKGGDPGEEREERREALTLAELATEYLERHAKPRKKTWAQDRDRFEKYVRPALGTRKITTITSAQIARLHHDIGTSAPYLANRLLEVLRKMFKLAVKWGYLPAGHDNPAVGHERFREKKRDRWLTPEELARLVEAIDLETGAPGGVEDSVCSQIVQALAARGPLTVAEVAEVVGHPRPKTSILLSALVKQGRLLRVGRGTYATPERHETPENLRLRAAFWLYLLLGVRKSELLGARWEDVDFGRAELRIPETKAGRAHSVPLGPAALAILRELPREGDNPFLFPGRKPGSPLQNIDGAWRRIRARAGVEDVRIHDLRRTVGSWLAQAGSSLLVVQKALNHSTYQAALVYARMSEDPVRRALEEHERRVLVAAGREPEAEVVPLRDAVDG